MVETIHTIFSSVFSVLMAHSEPSPSSAEQIFSRVDNANISSIFGLCGARTNGLSVQLY